MTVKIACVVLDCSDALLVGRFWSAAIARLVELGATRVADRDEYGYTWTLMADPEGNEFDLAKAL
jgi:hypothetical protein